MGNEIKYKKLFKVPFRKYKGNLKYYKTITYDYDTNENGNGNGNGNTDNLTGLLIFTYVNDKECILYYNFSVFFLISFEMENIYLIDKLQPHDLLFQNKIFNVQKININTENKFIYVICDFLKYSDFFNLFDFEDFLLDHNIYIKKFFNVSEIKKLKDFTKLLPFNTLCMYVPTSENIFSKYPYVIKEF